MKEADRRVRESDLKVLLPLKMEEEAVSQDTQATSRRSKRQRNDNSSQEPVEGMQPCQHLDFSPVRPILDFCPLEL